MIKKRLAQASVMGLANSFVTTASALLVSPIVIHALGQSTYGIWVLALSIVAYSRLLDRGLHNSAVRFLGVELGNQEKLGLGSVYNFFRKYYRLGGFLVMLLSILGSIGAMQMVEEGSDGMVIAGLTGLLGVAAGTTFFITIHSIFLKASLHYHFISAVGILKALIFAGGVWFTDRWGVLDLNNLLILHIVAQTAEQLAVYLYSRRLLPPDIREAPPIDRVQQRAILIYTTKNVFSLGATILRQQVDKQILAGFVSLPAVAQYSIGQKLSLMLSEVLNAFFGGSFLATFSQMLGSGRKEDMVEPLFLSVRLCAIMTLVGSTGMFFLGPAFIERWLGPGFEDAQIILQIIIFSSAISKIQYPLYSYMSALGRIGRMTALGVVGAILNLILSLALVQKYGIIGVAAASAVDGMLLGFILLPMLFAHTVGVSFLSYIWRTTLYPLLIIMVVVWPVGWWITQAFPLETYPQIALAATVLGVYMLIVSWFLLCGKALRQTLIKVARSFFVRVKKNN